ncbi:transglutaminase domain-containing protein [Psychroserpens sp. BH13MA-6]
MKKRTLVILLFIFFSTLGWSQNYKKVDSIVLTYPTKFSSVTKLADRISSDFSTDFDKVRAVYTWIINNVAYDLSESGIYSYEYSNKKEFEKRKAKFEKKLSSRVISKGRAVCEGYSTLFTAICDNLNIKSKIVSGNAKTIVRDIGKRYHSNHAWNIVLIENKSYLIDVTWGAGTYNKHFEKKANYFYFLTDPNLFIKKHYPDYYENALLDTKVEKEDFLNSPLLYNYDFKLINPSNGIIKKSEVGTLKFTFSYDKNVSSISYDLDKTNYQVTEFKNNEDLEFEIDLSGLNRERELVIYIDYKAIVAFKLE